MAVLAKLDGWIMTVLDCLGTEGKRGGGRQKEYVGKFEHYVKVAMEQLIQSLYECVKKWEPDDFIVSEEMGHVDTEGGVTEEILEIVEKKIYNATQPVYDKCSGKIYLTIKKDWFQEYVGRELGEVVDAYVAEYSTDFKKIVPLV